MPFYDDRQLILDGELHRRRRRLRTIGGLRDFELQNGEFHEISQYSLIMLKRVLPCFSPKMQLGPEISNPDLNGTFILLRAVAPRAHVVRIVGARALATTALALVRVAHL